LQPPYLPIKTHSSPHTPVSPPPLTPAAGTKYHRPHPQQSAGHSPLSRTPLHHINRQDIQVFLSVTTRPDQVESINSWISGICKDYPDIIPLGAMHPEHPEADILWMRQPEIKGIKLHSQRPRISLSLKSGVLGECSGIILLFKCYISNTKILNTKI